MMGKPFASSVRRWVSARRYRYASNSNENECQRIVTKTDRKWNEYNAKQDTFVVRPRACLRLFRWITTMNYFTSNTGTLSNSRNSPCRGQRTKSPFSSRERCLSISILQLAIIMSKYDTLRLKLQDDREQYEKYSDGSCFAVASSLANIVRVAVTHFLDQHLSGINAPYHWSSRWYYRGRREVYRQRLLNQRWI